MTHALLIDFGSTFTKVVAVSLINREVICTASAVSTVQTDARIGLEKCLDAVKPLVGTGATSRAVRIACSSAAGGLRIVVVGLTPSLSMMAGKNTALGAGARIIKTYAGILTVENVKEIKKLAPEIILLCGGTEDGNYDWPIENVRAISKNTGIQATLIYAGNSGIANQVRSILTNKRKECIVAKNVLPDLGILDPTDASEAIRDVFMKRIVNMKGLDKVKEQYVKDIIMPTPAAVLGAGELLASEACSKFAISKLMIIDIGGSTTDVYSFMATEKDPRIRIMGAPEPYSKRTVEGDLGMRSSVKSLTDLIGWAALAQKIRARKDELEHSVERRAIEPSYLPHNETEINIDQALATGAAYYAARRHAGERFAGYCGAVQEVQRGKDLTGIEFIVGTGGALVRGLRPADILKSALSNSTEENVLLPRSARFLIDKNYILYAVGLLCQIDKACASAILSSNLEFIE